MKNDDANTIKIDRPFRWDAGPTMRHAGNLYVIPAIGLPHPEPIFVRKIWSRNKSRKNQRVLLKAYKSIIQALW